MRLAPHHVKRSTLLTIALCALVLMGHHCPRGLSLRGYFELHRAGVDTYLGAFVPSSSESLESGWTKHTFDPDEGDGPTCIAGTPFTVFTKKRNPSKLLIFLQGGGACWQNFYFCSLAADEGPPSDSPLASGIWVDAFDTGAQSIDNPLADWSVVYVSYCDGSVFTGDHEVVDPAFQNLTGSPVRFHYGLRNLSAAVDVARAEFPHPRKVLVAGSSAGGVGASAFAPFLVRFAYWNFPRVFVFNDAGPIAINLDAVSAIEARTHDWQFERFYPASCTDCDPFGQATAIIDWRLKNDAGVREAFYSTDGDATNRFFINVFDQSAYRDLIVSTHGELHDAYPRRYRRFIRSGDDEHTALQRPTFFVGEANGVPLHAWTKAFLRRRPGPAWTDLVEDFVPLPEPTEP